MSLGEKKSLDGYLIDHARYRSHSLAATCSAETSTGSSSATTGTYNHRQIEWDTPGWEMCFLRKNTFIRGFPVLIWVEERVD